MALLSVEGIYEDGQVKLAESPGGVQKARVVITFLPDASSTEESAAADLERDRQRRREAGNQLLAHLRAGIDFGGWRFNREELYEERLNRIGRGDGG